ncbi:MAG: hypothetical protein QW392_01110 [Candidatus Jordarchaeales archaeon]
MEGIVGKETISDQSLTNLVKGFVLSDEKHFLDGLEMIGVPGDLYTEVKKRVEGEKKRSKINEVVIMVSCPKCNYKLILDPFIEVSFVLTVGEYSCPNCGALIKYNFATGGIEGFAEGGLVSSPLEANLKELRQEVERNLLSSYNARILGETHLMVAVKTEGSLFRLLIREYAKKLSSESWFAEWNWRVEVSIDEKKLGKASGFLIFSSKWMGPPPQTELRSSLNVERELRVGKVTARELSEFCINLEREVYEKLAAVLGEARLSADWIQPAKAVIPPLVTTEEDFVMELKKKIMEKELKKEERI